MFGERSNVHEPWGKESEVGEKGDLGVVGLR